MHCGTFTGIVELERLHQERMSPLAKTRSRSFGTGFKGRGMALGPLG